MGRKLGTVIIVSQRTFAVDHPFRLDHTLMHVALGESAVVCANVLVGQRLLAFINLVIGLDHSLMQARC